MIRRFVLTLVPVAAAWALLPGLALAADPPATEAAKAKTVTLLPVGSQGVKRITLSAKAAERLDVQTGRVGEEVVIRKLTVSGMVIYPQAGGAQDTATLARAGKGGASGFGSFGQVRLGMFPPEAAKPSPPTKPTQKADPARDESWVVVTLSPGEYERIAKDKPARITPLYTRDKGQAAMLAQASDAAPLEDGKRSMLSLHYVLPPGEHGLPSSTRVRVELQLAGSEDKQKVLPYSAIYYDAKGQAWVYTNPQPLVYERQSVTVQRVIGQQAVVADGPAVGTAVVTVGAALLYGTELFGK